MRGVWAVLTVALANLLVTTPVQASSQPLDAILARLESLERENTALRNRVRRLESSRPRSTSIETEQVPTRRAIVSQPASATVDTVHRTTLGHGDDGWSGPYFGASFGGIVSRSRMSSGDRYMVDLGGSPPFNIAGSQNSSAGAWSSSGGVTLDLFAGLNTRIESLLVGVQIEGSVADATFRSPGTKTYAYFDANGPTGQTASSPFRPQVHGRWMFSGLARLGWLADMSTLVYGIGGWTVGGFEYRNVIDNLFFQPNESFIAHGVAAGIGVERKIERNWTLRAEYRFAHFFPATVSNSFEVVSGSRTTQSFAAETRFENETHTIRLGISRQILAQ